MSRSGSYSYELKRQEGHHSVRSSEVVRLEDDPQVAVAFPLSDEVDPRPATVSATLPLRTLPGLRTPLNAPFELTANREALLESSPRHALLRRPGRARAWMLPPGPELAQQRCSAAQGG